MEPESSININLESIKNAIHLGVDFRKEYDMILRIAARLGDLSIIEHLCSIGCDISINNDDALKGAAACGHTEIVKYLVKHGANVQKMAKLLSCLQKTMDIWK